jgi:hypothetical protein
VPPLSTCGLCLACGAYTGAYGALLLFMANFVAILLASSLVFAVGGLGAEEGIMPLPRLTRRLITAALGFIFVAIILTKALVGMIEDRKRDKAIRSIITEQLHRDPTTGLVDIMQRMQSGELNILASVRTPRVFSPDRVKLMEEKLSGSLKTPLRLMVRCVLSRDVAPTGSLRAVIAPTLDGAFITEDLDPEARRIQLAEQTLRELMSRQQQLELQDTDLLYLAGDMVILATILAPRPLIPLEVSKFETAIREHLNDPHIRLLVRCLVTTDVTSRGRILYGRRHFGALPDGTAHVQELTRRHVESLGEMFVTNVDAVWSDDHWNVRAEVVGSRVLLPAEIKKIELAVSEQAGAPVKLLAWSRVELMVNESEYMSVEGYTEEKLGSTDPRENAGEIQ